MRSKIISGGILALLTFTTAADASPVEARTSSWPVQERVVVAANQQSAFFSRYVYDPAVVYPGPYDVSGIYYHNPGNPTWRAVKKLGSISCRSALDSFSRSGTWQGHLQQDGSCGDSAEPVDWALGNWLNFDAAKNR